MDMNSYLLILVLIGVAVCVEDDTTVHTPSGPVKGLKLTDTRTSETVYQFRKIRFAKPPIGNLRFRKPEPIDKWVEVYDATSFGNACAQNALAFMQDGSMNNSEDCLFLNIYVPRSLIGKAKLSVMFWIHGGGYTLGNGHNFDGTRLAIDGNVIVVTINYRLGIFGFLPLYHPASRGNIGLWDQKQALHWVHDNIAAFRGDPESVTIFGVSAGGFCASYHSLIPSNVGLFQRVIAQSGVASKVFMAREKGVEKATRLLAERTGCSKDDLYKFVDCLREQTTEDLLKASDTFQDMPLDRLDFEMFYGPSVDGDLFPAHPLRLLDDKSSPASQFFRSLDFMTGTMSQEGSLLFVFASPPLQQHFNFNIGEHVPFEFICDGIVKSFVDVHYQSCPDIINKICKFYKTNGARDDQSNRAADLIADLYYTWSTGEILDLHSKLNGGRTYEYQISKRSPVPFIPFPEWFTGSGHCDEIIFLFNTEKEDGGMLKTPLSGTDRLTSERMISLWSSFAKTGIPNAGEHSVPWMEYDVDRRMYLDIDDDLSLKQNLKRETIKFWSEEIPQPNLDEVYTIRHDEL